MALELTSRAFRNGEYIPPRYTADGEAVSPPLTWSGVPDGTREFALICEDPDAPLPKPFVHWIAYGLSANTTFLPEGLANEYRIFAPVMADQGINTLLAPGYTPPNPPFWHRAHRYQFRLYALDEPLELPPGAGRQAFFHALDGHVLAEATLTGLYEKRAAIRMRSALRWSAGVGLGLVVVNRWRRAAPGSAAA